MIKRILIALLLIPCLCTAQVQKEVPLKTSASPFGYLEFTPTSTDTSKLPLIVFLHGNGEIGNGVSDLYKVAKTGLPALLKAGKGPNQFIVLSPQRPKTGLEPAMVERFIVYAMSSYHVDPARIYVVGLSGGAIAGMAYIKTYHRAAASILICGKTSTAGISKINTPLWLFHGDADGTVSVGGSTNLYKTLMACDALKTLCVEQIKQDYRITIYAGVNHDSWTRTFNLSGIGTGKIEHNFGTWYNKDVRKCNTYDQNIYDWLLQHRKQA